MDKRLEEYRLRKRREEMMNKAKEKIAGLVSFGRRSKNVGNESMEPFLPTTHHSTDTDIHISRTIIDDDTNNDDYLDPSEILSTCSDDETLPECCTYTDYVYYALWFLTWAIGYGIFIYLEFGIVYLIVTGLIFMFANTRSGKKKRNEMSAYSVFNKNCESIDGTLKAEQLERQLIYGRLT